MTTKQCETRSFTREEFYEFVWSAPATKLAKELGCSEVMIGMACRSYKIPKPYTGYWAKLANRKTPEKTPLPASDDPELQTMSFFKYPDYEASLNEPPRELQYDEDVLEILDKAKQLDPVQVPESLRNPHKLVVATRDRIAKELADSNIPWCERDYESRSEGPATLSIDVTNDCTRRALRIMDAFIKRVEKIGGTVEIRKSGYDGRSRATTVVIADEAVTTIRLREKHKQVRKSNKGIKFEWERNRTELVPTGLLLFDRGPSSYEGELLKDGVKKKIEDGLNDLIIDLVKKAGEIRIRRREQEEIRRRQEGAARIQREREEEILRRKEELEKRQAKEKARVDELFDHANAWRRSQMVKDYLDQVCASYALPDGSVPLDSNLAEYLRWGSEQADRLDPLRESPHSVLDETIDVSQSGPQRPR